MITVAPSLDTPWCLPVPPLSKLRSSCTRLSGEKLTHAGICAGFQQLNRCRMAKNMRGDAPWCAIYPALLQMGGVATHEFINPIPRQRLPAVRGNHRTIRGVPNWQPVEESLQQRYRFLPEGTD